MTGLATSPNRLLGVIIGAAYVVLGIVGFFVTTKVGFASPDGALLAGVLELNPLHNILNLLVGAALAMAGLSGRAISARVNSVVGALLLVLGLVGLFLVESSINILAINVAGNVLHFATAAVLLAVGLGAEKHPAVARDQLSS